MTSVPGEVEILERCRSGDEAALGVLFRSHHPKALRTAFAVTGDRHLAEDAVQEAFFKAVRSSSKLRPGVPFEWWLLRSVMWAARAQLRRRRRPDLHLRPPQELAASGTDSPESVSDSRIVVLHALAALSVRHRQTIVARFYLQLSEQETAALLGCRVGTVKSRTSRALRALSEDPVLSNAFQETNGGEARATTRRPV